MLKPPAEEVRGMKVLVLDVVEANEAGRRLDPTKREAGGCVSDGRSSLEESVFCRHLPRDSSPAQTLLRSITLLLSEAEGRLMYCLIEMLLVPAPRLGLADDELLLRGVGLRGFGARTAPGGGEASHPVIGGSSSGLAGLFVFVFFLRACHRSSGSAKLSDPLACRSGASCDSLALALTGRSSSSSCLCSAAQWREL